MKCLLFLLLLVMCSALCISSEIINAYNTAAATTNLPPPCQSEIYCYGSLLHTIQMASVFPDSKTFVDMKLKSPVSETLAAFKNLTQTYGSSPNVTILKGFVDKYFSEPGSELENCTLSDWHESPKFLKSINNADYRDWAKVLHEKWNKLCRKMIPDVERNPDQYSIIYVENPFVIPGGRFREYYYWDTYWVFRGLLYSELDNTAKGILNNFFSVIKKYNFMPTGGRVYYLHRSQPPLLAPMVQSYLEYTKDDKFAIDNVETLELEYKFWMDNRIQTVKGHKMAYYDEFSTGPRPESYGEDMNTAKDYTTDETKLEFFRNIKAAAESGMDFSSRWFITSNGDNDGALKDTKARNIIPVDLNAILYWNANIIAGIYEKAGNASKAAEYKQEAKRIFEAVQAVLWSPEYGVWLDYDVINNKSRNYFVPTNLSPLWTKCYNVSNAESLSTSILKYINSTGIQNYPGGIPTTIFRTGQQWDFPNAWAPMQYVVVQGLDNLGTAGAKELAKDFANKWIISNFKAFNETKDMFEKYNVETVGEYGGGGEYENQRGFGWSNGVIIEFLAKYKSNAFSNQISYFVISASCVVTLLFNLIKF